MLVRDLKGGLFSKKKKKLNLNESLSPISVLSFLFILYQQHVPGYLAKASEFASKGVDNIYVLAVNDAFVTKAWGKTFASNNESGKVKFVADDHGAFASATGLIFDASAFLGGPRAKRAALVIVSSKFIEFCFAGAK